MIERPIITYSDINRVSLQRAIPSLLVTFNTNYLTMTEYQLYIV